MDTCIAIIMYCLRLFLLFTFKKNFFGGPICIEYVFMQNFKFGGVTVLAVQLFNKIKRKKKKKKKKKKRKKTKHEKTCFAVFPGCYVEIHLFLLNVFLFVCF